MYSPHRSTLVLACTLAFAIAGAAFAQTTVPAAPTVTPAPSCQKPGAPPSSGTSEIGKAASDLKRNNWMRDMKAYLDCLKAFIADHQAQSSRHAAAANAAVEEYNQSIKTLNEQIEAPKQ
jgi:hypothetical protein